MSGENQNQNYQQAPKARKKRSPSRFMVLRDITPDNLTADVTSALGALGISDPDKRIFVLELEPAGVKQARVEVKKKQVVGDLLTVCVRRRGKATVQTTLDIVGL